MPLDGIQVENCVGAQDWHVLDDGLSDEEAVERVAVVMRQCYQSGSVPRVDRQDCESVVEDRMLNKVRKWFARVSFPVLTLIAISQ
jgi:hypothetical protein